MGIVFLAYELQQNNVLMQAQAGQSLSENRVGNSRAILEMPSVAALAVKLDSGANLTPEEKWQEMAIYQRMMINWEWEYLEFRAGRLAEDQLPINAWVRNLEGKSFFPTPRLREYWDDRKVRFDADFVAFVESHMNH